ncbi:MAG TPA: sigma 54-interacting transcriptional regulator [Vicinamibacteria bacterium]|nr:sigma 54-interacting transcriptional regulator [Vicinamibacteria bacterium]
MPEKDTPPVERDEEGSTVRLSSDGGEESLVRQFSVEVVDGPAAGMIFESKGQRTILGKDRSSDLVLADPTVSRFHCEFRVEGERIVIQDLNSLNGTYVNGTRVIAAYLEEKATIGLGRCVLRFRRGSGQVSIPLSAESQFGALVGESEAMRAVFAALSRVAASDSTLLLTGETGTGKDVAAESVHIVSSRRDGPFVVVDCGAIPGTLLESELFGHERGAFTGAEREHKGAFERASGGTLFLDEIGELSLDLQPKLLRALERREIRRLGGSGSIATDVRIIAATNRNLLEEVNARSFRSDLYYRLAVAEVELPPLRERREDIPLLVAHLLDDLGSQSSRFSEEVLSETFLDELARHTWPGNVRELRNHIERCLLFGRMGPRVEEARSEVLPELDLGEPLAAARRRWVGTFERRYLEGLLEQSGGNVSDAARRAGVNRAHFHRLLARNGLR